MESYRQQHRMIRVTRQRQAGMTALGFLILAALVGVVGLGAIKVVPMYMKNMRMTQILNDVESELSGQSSTPVTIRQEIAKRFAVEDIRMDVNALKIAQSKNGYTLHMQYEERAPYVAGIYLVLVYDKQVEIRR